MVSARSVAVWEYCHLGPADSFQALVATLKLKGSQGWELAGVTNDGGKVYANLRRRVDVPLAASGDTTRLRAA